MASLILPCVPRFGEPVKSALVWLGAADQTVEPALRDRFDQMLKPHEITIVPRQPSVPNSGTPNGHSCGAPHHAHQKIMLTRLQIASLPVRLTVMADQESQRTGLCCHGSVPRRSGWPRRRPEQTVGT